MKKLYIEYNASTKIYYGNIEIKDDNGYHVNAHSIMNIHLDDIDEVIKALKDVRDKHFEYVPKKQVIFEKKIDCDKC